MKVRIEFEVLNGKSSSDSLTVKHDGIAQKQITQLGIFAGSDTIDYQVEKLLIKVNDEVKREFSFLATGQFHTDRIYESLLRKFGRLADGEKVALNPEDRLLFDMFEEIRRRELEALNAKTNSNKQTVSEGN